MLAKPIKCLEERWVRKEEGRDGGVFRPHRPLSSLFCSLCCMQQVKCEIFRRRKGEAFAGAKLFAGACAAVLLTIIISEKT